MADEMAPSEASSILEDLQRLRQLVADLTILMQSQREALKQHGVSLPAGTLKALEDVLQRIVGVEADVGALVKERDQFRALADTAALINSTLDLTQVLNEVMDTLVKLTGAERGYLMLRDEQTGELAFRVARNMDRETLAEEEFEVSRSIVREVAGSGQAVVTTNAQLDPRFSEQDSVVGLQLLSILCVPLKLRDTVTGVIYADNRIQEGLFTESDLDLLAAFADQAAVAIQNAQLFESVLEMKNLQDDIFASISSGVITTDLQENVTLINRAAAEILNIRDAYALGGSLGDILPPLDARFERVMDEVRQLEQVMRAIEFEPDMPERGQITLSMNLSPLKDAESATQGIAIVLNDLTDQKRREAQIAGVRRYLPAEVVDGLTDVDALKLGGTRQEVSILFGDIRGFSSFSELVSPERLVEIINTYFTIASEAIHFQEGVIDKFMGDAVMALFNPSIRPQADHALRAVRAAVAMRADIDAFHERVPAKDRLQFGIGVHTGEAVTGNIGSPDRLEYSALGDTVNLAKRLQEAAASGQILISEETYRQVRDAVQVEKLEPIQVRGRSQYTQIYELLAIEG
jgi:PAS domain S-box-containing protein